SVEGFTLKLNEPVQVQTSVFLHRLRVAGIPYASYVGKQLARRSTRRRTDEEPEAGGGDALTRVSEAGEAQWTPSTDVARIEKIVLGDTLEQVVGRSLEEQLGAARDTGAAAGVLLEAVVASSGKTVGAALAACDRFAATDEDLPSLARSAS